MITLLRKVIVWLIDVHEYVCHEWRRSKLYLGTEQNFREQNFKKSH